MSRDNALSTGRMGGCRRAKELHPAVPRCYSASATALRFVLPPQQNAVRIGQLILVYIFNLLHILREDFFMSEIQANTAALNPGLYPHPFSKAYWRDAASELKKTKMLTVAAMMIALRVVLKLVSIPIAPGLNVNTAFFANALGAMIFGPVMAAICAVITDVLGYLVKPEGVYFIPFILTEVAGSVIFALFLYRAKVNPVRVMLSRFCICFFVNVVLQTPIYIWYYALYMGGKTYALTIPGIIKNLFMFPIESVVLTIFLGAIVPITNKLGLTYGGADAKYSLQFTKKQLATLAALFVVGLACVAGYLTYYYQTTSLSAKYSTEERYEKNVSMIPVVQAQQPDLADDTLVTTIDSAYQAFLGSEITYTVVIYDVDEEALANYSQSLDAIRGMSKSKAKAVSDEGVMAPVGTVVIVINKNTNEVVSYTGK